MAANESYYDCDEEEFFLTALEEQFTELSLDTDEFHGISPVTINNDATTPGYEADDHGDIDAPLQASALQNELHLIDAPKQAKRFTQTNSSTPKRKLQFIRNPYVKTFKQIADEFVRGDRQSIEKDQSINCEQESVVQQLVNLPNELENDTLTQLPSLSQLIREQRRSHILSPFSQKLKSVILRQDHLQKRQQRIEVSKKAQRLSLRV